MRALYFSLTKRLTLTVRVGCVDMSFVVGKVLKKAFEESEGLPVLFLFDNVEEFTSGQGKEGTNLKKSFMEFLEKLIGYYKDRQTRALRILLTSRTPLNEVNNVVDYELKPLGDNFSEKILLSDEPTDINMVQKEKLLSVCNGKPLLLKGLAAILKQERKRPSDLINEIEKFIRDFEEKGDTPKSKHEELQDAKEKAYGFEEGVGHGEKSVIHEMFNTLPSDCLKASAVSLSLFCDPFSVATAAQVLGISVPETVAQLEGLETCAIISVVNREEKELMYDIHPLLKKYADSIKDDELFVESYTKAKGHFYEIFMSKLRDIAGFVDADYVKAYKMFTSDSANYEFAIDISLESEFFSIPGEFRDNALIVSLVNALLSNEKKCELFKSWAKMCSDDGKSGSLFRAHLKCWESLYVRDQDGPSEAFKVLEQAANSLGKVQDTTTENFTLTQGLHSYFEGEIYYKKSDFKKALDCLQLSLDLMEKQPQVNDILTRCYNAMGNCYCGLKDLTKALEFYTKALKMTEKELRSGKYRYSLPVYKNQIGTVYHGQGNYDKAVEYYKEAIRLLEELGMSGYEDEADFYRNLANSYLCQRKYKEARKPADKAFEIRRKRLGDHPDTVRSIFQQGVIQANLQEPEKALNLFRNAWEMEKSLKPGNHSEVWKMLIDSIIYLMADDSQKTEFKKEALAFCQRFWKEERDSSRFGFTESNRLIIDAIVELLGDIEGERDVHHEYEKEELWFYDGFVDETEIDFCTTFDAATDRRTLNEMLNNRAPLFKEAAKTQGSASREKDDFITKRKPVSEEEDEEIEVTSEESAEDQVDDLTSEEKIEITSEDENEYSSFFRQMDEGSIVLHRGKVVKEGTQWDLKQVAVHVIFPPDAVPEDRTLTLLRWNPHARCPPLLYHEAIVSDVIELSAVDSPGILHFNEAVTIVIPHCASNLKGYEVVIKTLVDSETNEWDDSVELEDVRTQDDIKGDHAGYGDVQDFLFPVAISKIAQCSTFVVVCRLRSHRHTITSQESKLVWPEFPLARISFPQNAVPHDESVEIIVKLQEVSQKLFKNKQILPGPIMRITTPRAVEFLKPVTIQIPLSLGERYRRRDIDLSIVRVRVLFKESNLEEQEWKEITDKLGAPPRFDGNIITFEVTHFSNFWTLVKQFWNKRALRGGFDAVIDQTVKSEINKLDYVPKAASFLAFVPGGTRLRNESQLRLYCVPTCKKREVQDDERKDDNVKIADGSSDEPMYFNDKAYMFLSEGIVTAISPERLRTFHVSFQDEPFLKSLQIRVEKRGDLTVSFYRSQEKDVNNRLCELEVPLPPQRADLTDEHKKCFDKVISLPEEGGEDLKHMRDRLLEETKTPSRERLEWLSMKLTLWEPLARRLGFSEGQIIGFHKDNEEWAKKALSMLLRWKQKKGSDATYAVLCAALSHELVGRKDLAEEVIKL
ncbi:uncharacterized protein [Montipora foliosa]|uniref:uncharacterized protein isoform X2 n=1 Tax=Montipora foliosa TaxID=591990 RepID=UPI0035F182BA